DRSRCRPVLPVPGDERAADFSDGWAAPGPRRRRRPFPRLRHKAADSRRECLVIAAADELSGLVPERHGGLFPAPLAYRAETNVVTLGPLIPPPFRRSGHGNGSSKRLGYLVSTSTRKARMEARQVISDAT